MKKRILSAFLSLCIAGSTGSALMSMSMPVEAANNNVIYIPRNYYLNVPTKEQIIEKYNELLFDVGQNISYERDYSFKNPFVPGEVGTCRLPGIDHKQGRERHSGFLYAAGNLVSG